MSKTKDKALNCQAGFTLVELAIVMIIIGLLIGGVLKGQQLITNAQVTATVAQIKAIDAATTSFRDQFNNVPGDILLPTTVVPNCPLAGNCGIPGNGDGRVEQTAAFTAVTFAAVPTQEQLGYWAQLSAAGLLTGIDAPTAAQGATGGWGGYAPSSKISGGGFDVGWYGGGIALNGLQNTTVLDPAPSGEYLSLHGTAGAISAGAAVDSFLTPNLADRIDTKIDDGQPNTGTVQAAGFAAAGAAGCASAAGIAGAYNQSLTTTICSLYIQFQN